MLIKAATHLRPLLRLGGVLPSPTASNAPNAFSSNAHLQAVQAQQTPASLIAQGNAPRARADGPGPDGGQAGPGSGPGSSSSSGPGPNTGAGTNTGYTSYARVFATHSSSTGHQLNQKRRETERRKLPLDSEPTAGADRLDALKNGRPLLHLMDITERPRLPATSASHPTTTATSGGITIVSLPETTTVQSLATLASRRRRHAASSHRLENADEDDGQAFVDSDLLHVVVSPDAAAAAAPARTGQQHRLRKPRPWTAVGIRPANAQGQGVDVPRTAGYPIRLLTTAAATATAAAATSTNTSAPASSKRRIHVHAQDDLQIMTRRSSIQVRRNSTATSVPSSTQEPSTAEGGEIELSPEEEAMRQELVVRDTERAEEILRSLSAAAGNDAEHILSLCSAYRSQDTAAAALGPPYYSTRGYTAVLTALSALRAPGAPITAILTTYNEMLERDVLPNLTTYGVVIDALLERDEEIAGAVKRVAKRRRWIDWERKRLLETGTTTASVHATGITRRNAALKEQEDELALLAQENNYESAIKLFRSAIVYNRHRPFKVRTYLALLAAAARRGDVAVAIQVWGHHESVHSTSSGQQNEASQSSSSSPPPVVTRMYTLLIQAYAQAREPSGIKEVLDEFLAQERAGAIMDGRNAGGVVDMEAGNAAERTVAGLFAEVVQAYIVAGESEKGLALLNEIAAEQSRRSSAFDESVKKQSEAGSLPPLTRVLLARTVFALLSANDRPAALRLTRDLAHGEGILGSALGGEAERRVVVAQCTQYLLNDALLAGDIEALVQAVELLPSRVDEKGMEDGVVDAKAEADGEVSAHTALIARTLVLFAAATTTAPSGSEGETTTTTPTTYPLATALALLRAFDMPRVREQCHMGTYGPAPLSALVRACFQADAPQDALYVLSFLGHGAPLSVNVAREYRDQLFAAAGGYDEAVAVADVLARNGCYPSTRDALDLCRRYTSATAPAKWTPERVATLIKIFEVPAAAVEAEAVRGEDARDFDLALDRFVADLAAARVTIATPELERLMNVLALRKGYEQAESILRDAFGQEAVAPLLASAAETASASSPLDSGSDTFAAPSETSSAPTSVAPAYHINKKIASLVDAHYGPRATSTPLAAYATLKQALVKGAVPDPFVVGRLLQALARMGEEAKVRELYSLAHEIIVTLLSPDRQLAAWIHVEDLMLIASCHLGHLEQAGLHRARIIEQGVAPSADAYATMISSTKDTTDDASVARELWDESQRYGVKPHLYLYNTIISKLSKARKAETALEFFKNMKAEGLRPSSVTYGAVINACVRVGDVESATTLFQEMQAMPNFKPRVPPYNTMMQMHLQTQPSRELVLHYYNQMIQANVSPSAHTYKLLLDAYGTLQPIDLDAMQKVFDNLCKDRRIDVQGTHWASLIHAYGNVAGQPEKAIEIFESIPSHSSTRSKDIEPVCWEAILNVLASAKMADRMEEYVTRMRQQHIRPTAYINNMLIRGYAAVDKLEKSREIFESMQDAVMGVAAPNNHPALLTSSGQSKPVTTAQTDIVFREPST
ncbi:hypothetical protein QFC19_001548 [Naganishia cerealis]|uniref:Uncharacterized protein n=1 Tax=Naganishia cerealis TaxID=610337 RepID=A0ACC2WFA8_9TREE|nr:hypothetical protein QFC19_001548 [Naganishia cerealis]